MGHIKKSRAEQEKYSGAGSGTAGMATTDMRDGGDDGLRRHAIACNSVLPWKI